MLCQARTGRTAAAGRVRGRLISRRQTSCIWQSRTFQQPPFDHVSVDGSPRLRGEHPRNNMDQRFLNRRGPLPVASCRWHTPAESDPRSLFHAGARVGIGQSLSCVVSWSKVGQR